MTFICIEREGAKERGDKTQAKDGREGGRDIHPCWGFVAANVIAWNGAKTLDGFWICIVFLHDWAIEAHIRIRDLISFTFGVVEGFKPWIDGMLGSEKLASPS